jgi:hypothetical protein
MLFLDNVIAYHPACYFRGYRPAFLQVRRGPPRVGIAWINTKTYIKSGPIATLDFFTLAAQSPFPLDRGGGLIGEQRVETFRLIHLHEGG